YLYDAIFFSGRDISTLEPPSHNLFFRLIRSLPIPSHFLWSHHTYFALFTCGKGISFFIYYFTLSVGHRKTYSTEPLCTINRVTGNNRRSFCQSVAFRQRTARNSLPLLCYCILNSHSPSHGYF